MTAIPVLRSNSPADLLALPSYLFTFHPTESVVVIAMKGNVVNFSARLDADWFLTHFDQAADQVLNAAANIGACDFFLLGYSEDPDLAEISVTEVADIVGRHRVAAALITDGELYWSLIDGDGPHPFNPDTSAITAQAVYTGVNIHATREEAVAPVTGWEQPDDGQVDEALAEIAALTDEEAMDLLAALAEAEPAVSGADALKLACLLLDDDRCGAIVTRLNTTTAEVIWANLAAARRVTPEVVQPTVVALLGVACWLAGHGAQATACIEQLASLDPRHPIGTMLASVHQHGIPPHKWDED